MASFLFLAIFLAAQLLGKSEHAGASLGARGQRPVAVEVGVPPLGGEGPLSAARCPLSHAGAAVLSWSPDHDTVSTKGLQRHPGDLRSQHVSRSGDRPQRLLTQNRVFAGRTVII